MVKLLLQKRAIEMRKAGYSYTYIKNKIGVSKSTLSSWLSKIVYIPNKETVNKIKQARNSAIETQKEKKVKSIKDAKNLSIRDIGRFTKRDLFMLGIGIYIGEGSKTIRNSSIRVTNSDPKIIKTTILWFKKICNLQNINFSIRIHLYPDNNQEKAISFWLKEIGLPRDSLLKTWIDVRTDKKRKNFGKLPYGTAHLTIKSAGTKKAGVFLFRRILSWIDIVHEKAGLV